MFLNFVNSFQPNTRQSNVYFLCSKLNQKLFLEIQRGNTIYKSNFFGLALLQLCQVQYMSGKNKK